MCREFLFVCSQVDKEETRTVGGVLLPSSAAKKSTAGTVVALGEATAVKVGGRVEGWG
jgi:chaperonin GroES